MEVFILLLIIFVPFIWYIVRMLRYTDETVGDDSPLKRQISYQYGPGEFLRWANTPLAGSLCLLLSWMCWLLLSNLASGASIWHYMLLIALVGLWVGSLYFLYVFWLLEAKFRTIIRDTSLVADPDTKSLTVHREKLSALLTADNVSQIEHHVTRQGKFDYSHYRFVDQQGQSTFFYDYGQGLSFAIEAYFKGVPIRTVIHSFPFNNVPVS